MEKELARQGMHVAFGTLFIAVLVLLGREAVVAVSVLAILPGLLAALLIRRGVKLPLISSVLGKAERDYEKHFPGKGAFLFLASLMLVLIVFPGIEVAVGALCVAVYGDGASTLFGKRFGKHKIGDKSIEGTLGGIIVAALFLSIFFRPGVAVVAAVAGMLAEYIPLDDNFTIPLASGFALMFLI